MSEEGNQTSRREFLGKTLRATGYVVPLIVAMKMSSREAWAEQYGGSATGTDGIISQQTSHGNGRDCKTVFGRILNPKCWL